MGLSKVRNMLEEMNKSYRRGSQHSGSSGVSSFSTQQSDNFDSEDKLFKLPSDAKMLRRARDVHTSIDFMALEAGPEHSGQGGPWQRVETSNRFVVFRRQVTVHADGNQLPGLEVMCAGRLDASLEEVASILRPTSEADFAGITQGLYPKSFVFGSLDRDVPCSGVPEEEPQSNNHEPAENPGEKLTVKTCSFTRTAFFARNEQWCFFDFFQRKKDRDGFTISQCALPPDEPTPGRVVGVNARVDQLHGLNTSYLVDQLPNRKGLRVVFRAWFETPMKSLEPCSSWRTSSMRSSSQLSSYSSSSSFGGHEEHSDSKARDRRLLALAHGITKIPELIRRRRFGIQVPADMDMQAANTRCPCCTHSLAPVKMTLALAASAFTKRSLRSLKMDTRRCYLCGYFVCINCWNAEYMENKVGRVAGVIVCTRCHGGVKACEYSEVSSSDSRGPVKVVDDDTSHSHAPLLVDFLAASLTNAPVGGADRVAVLAVVRTLLQHNEASDDSEYDDSYNDDDDGDEGFDCNQQNDNMALVELGTYLSDETLLPELADCVLANAERRTYHIDLPDDPATSVPSSVIPSHDSDRLEMIKDNGLLQLAYQLAPLKSIPDSFDNACDVRDLELLCQLAVRATGCSEAFVTVMGVKHNHILAATHPAFCHAAVPRQQTMCQHTILTSKPFVASHPEADVRFHQIEAVKLLRIRYYVGFPVTVKFDDNNSSSEMPVGTLCCIDSNARSELTRSQYATMKRLTDAASRLIQLKGRQVQQQLDPKLVSKPDFPMAA